MTSATIKLIHDSIAQAAEPLGFSKRGENWYADRVESILVINPQKSQYSQQYYLNLGIYFKGLGTNLIPKEQDCHLRARLCALVDAHTAKEIEAILNFNHVESFSERQKSLSALIENNGLPFLEAYSSLAGVRVGHSEGRLDALAVSKALREKL